VRSRIHLPRSLRNWFATRAFSHLHLHCGSAHCVADWTGWAAVQRRHVAGL